MPLLFVCMMLVLAACASPTLTATPTVIPTNTATPAPPTSTPAPTATPAPKPVAGTLYVDAAYSQGKVSRLVFGTNHGPWTFLNPDVYPQFKESGLTLIRFPGGNWGDENDIEQWHVDQFITLCRMINAEPLISVRLLGGTPEKAVALLRYTIQQGYHVRYWSIGNEPSLYAPRHPEWDTAYYNAEWRKFAQAMKAADPNIILVGPDTNQFMGEPTIDPKDKSGRDWLREFLKVNGDWVDVVAVHRYPFPVRMGERPTRDELFADTPRWDTLVTNLRQAVREETGRDLPIAITEFNSSWSGTSGGETGMDTLNNAVWLGDVLGRLIRQRVDILAQFSLQSGANVGGYGLFTRDAVRPMYYTYQIYKSLGDELVFAASDTPRLSIYAACKGDVLTLILVNLSDQPITRPLVLDHFSPSGPAQVKLFDEKHKATDQTDVALAGKTDYTVPSLSITLLTIPGQVTRP
ncbi:MAG TPA: hypothetical protein VII92_16800, partial [Anaerolineae bacterium]